VGILGIRPGGGGSKVGAVLEWLAEAFAWFEGTAPVSWFDGAVADLLPWFVDSASSRKGPAGNLLVSFVEASWFNGAVADSLLWFVHAALSGEGPAGDLLL